MTDTPTNDPVSEVMLWIGQRISEIEGDRRNFDFLSERECRELRSLRVIRAAMSARSPVGWEDEAFAMAGELRRAATRSGRMYLAERANEAADLLQRLGDK